jgi:trimeric autotransporter adhesin
VVTQLATYAAPYDPASLVPDNNGSLYIGDIASVVHKLNLTTNISTNIAGNGTYGYSGDGLPATAAKIENVWGVALDLSRNLYIADRTARVIRRVDGQSGIITTFAGTGACANNGDGGPANQANFCTPQQIAVDAAGNNLYVSDLSYGQVRKIDLTTNIITTVAGGGSSLVEGIAATSALLTPDSIALDSAGNLYIGDHNHENIRKVSAATGLINTIAGNGTYGDSGDGGQAIKATITTPSCIAISAAGNIYFGDNTAVRRIDSATGVITTVTGVPSGFSMSFDSVGNLYALNVRIVDKVTGLN